MFARELGTTSRYPIREYTTLNILPLYGTYICSVSDGTYVTLIQQPASFVHAEILTRFSSVSPENESSNLDHLVHLKWLDLSFNNIKAITGLDKLTELMDLSLYNNQVKRRVGCEHLSLRGACTLYAVPTRAIYSRHPSRFLFVRYIRAAPPLCRWCWGRVAVAANIGRYSAVCPLVPLPHLDSRTV